MAKKQKTKSGKSTKSKSSTKKGNSLKWVTDPRTRQILGGLLMAFGVFLFLSLLSGLFTWRIDQSELYPDHTDVHNWLGPIGASLVDTFMRHGFGLVGFLFPYLFVVLGYKLINPATNISLYRNLKYALMIIGWVSLVLGFLFSNSLSIIAGTFGQGYYSWMKSMIGAVGVFLVLLFSLFAILVWEFNVDFIAIWKNIKAKLDKGNRSIEEDIEPFDDDDDITIAGETLFEKDKIALEDDKDDGDELKLEMEEPVRDTGAEIIDSFGKKEVKEEAPKMESSEEDELSLDIEEAVNEEEGKEISRNKIDTPYDPRLDLSSYKFPKLEFLNAYGEGKTEVTKEDLEKSKNLIIETLKNYKIGISQIKATIGPTVTLFEIVPAPGVKISKIKNLEDDIALSLAALGIRIIAPIPGRGTIGIEVPNKKPEIVSMRAVLQSKKYQESTYDLPVCLGRTISNEVYVADLARMPHLLMAGATGQGKSVGLNAILVSLLYKKHPAELKLVLVDPKKVELTLYNRIERHYLAKLPGDADAIITDNKQVITTLNSLCVEMDNRYALLQNAMVRNITEYNAKFIKRKLNPEEGHRFLPFIVVVIDEVADLIMTAGKEVEHPIGRLAQLARAIGIHLVLATQRPSVNIITGTIKANFPARIAFRVSSKIDSRTILDTNGADQLIGKGDMLFSNGSDIIRLQCPFVDTPEVEVITSFIGEQRGYSNAYELPEVQEESSGGGAEIDDGERDALFEDAARIVVQHQQGSTSLLQRRLKVGYNRAGRLIDQLERANIVGPFEGSKARQVLVPDEYALEQYLNELE